VLSFRPESLVGHVLAGSYRAVALLGSGGLGHVYEAVKTGFHDERLALKLLRPELRSRDELVLRFEREALAASKIDHPNVLRVHRPIVIDGEWSFFTMERLVGLDLADTMSQGARLHARRIVHIVSQAARGLGAAHERGVVHRDVKPENLFIVHDASGTETVKVLDFGTAWMEGVSRAVGRITARGKTLGTPEYLAPEQLEGAAPHPTADVYSLGVVLFELFAGRVPYSGRTWVDIARQHREAAIPVIENLPQPLQTIIERCMAKNAAERFSSMGELEAQMQPFVAKP
jgi:eukaryotic-like serine/threonine-protein kinase